MDKLFTVREVCKQLRVSAGTLYAWRKREYGPAYLKIGQACRYPASAIDGFMRASAKAPTSTSFTPQAASRGARTKPKRTPRKGATP